MRHGQPGVTNLLVFVFAKYDLEVLCRWSKIKRSAYNLIDRPYQMRTLGLRQLFGQFYETVMAARAASCVHALEYFAGNALSMPTVGGLCVPR